MHLQKYPFYAFMQTRERKYKRIYERKWKI